MLLISGRSVAVAIAFIVPLVLARILAPSVFGTYRQLLLIFTTIYGIAQLGMAGSSGRVPDHGNLETLLEQFA